MAHLQHEASIRVRKNTKWFWSHISTNYKISDTAALSFQNGKRIYETMETPKFYTAHSFSLA